MLRLLLNADSSPANTGRYSPWVPGAVAMSPLEISEPPLQPFQASSGSLFLMTHFFQIVLAIRAEEKLEKITYEVKLGGKGGNGRQNISSSPSKK